MNHGCTMHIVNVPFRRCRSSKQRNDLRFGMCHRRKRVCSILTYFFHIDFALKMRCRPSITQCFDALSNFMTAHQRRYAFRMRMNGIQIYTHTKPYAWSTKWMKANLDFVVWKSHWQFCCTAKIIWNNTNWTLDQHIRSSPLRCISHYFF